MKRPAGVTISAVVVLVGSGLAVLSGALMILAFFITPATDSMPAFTRYSVLIMSVFMLGLASWGIVTGINLLQLREWARISMLVFSGLLLVMAVPGLLMMLVMPFPTPPATAVPPGVAAPQMESMMTAVRIGMAAFYALLSVLGGWWLYFFLSRPIREQFRGSAAAASTWTPAVDSLAPPSRKRPVSITIIAYLALAGACVFPFLRLFNLPLTFLGFYFTGGKASLIVTGYMTVQFLMAYGLLKLEKWGRSLAIYYFNFAIFNSIISVILPGAQARYEEAMTVMQGSMGLPATQVQVPIWFSLVFSLPTIAIQLWFVVTRKQAFEGPHGPLASQ
jgi:ABC-type antimicrobial peptide transport system permease subunit